MLVFGIGPSHSIFYQFQNTVLDQNHSDVVLCDSIFLEWTEIGVDAFEGGLDSVFALIVHADADQYFYALEKVAALFALL